MKREILWIVGAVLVLSGPSATAQDSGAGSTPPAGNPLGGLFQIAPQYQSGNNGQQEPASQSNPLQGLFNIAPQYQSGNSVDVHPPENTSNQFQNFFTNGAQYQSGVDVQPQPKFLDPTFIKDQIEKGYTPSPAEKAMVMDKFPDFYKKDEPVKPAGGAAAQQKAAPTDKPAAQVAKAAVKKKIKKAATKKDETPPPKPLVYNPLKDAVFLYQTQQYDQSLQALSAYLKTNPDDPQAHYLSAINLAAQGNNSLAADEYRAVIRLVPTSKLAQQAITGLRKIGGDMPEPPNLPALKTHP
jgi:tetratricopeptide (TPR) repeat protein